MSGKLKMSEFMYDVATLIELIESKPCIWDKTCDIYKVKIVKAKAWREICAFLEGDFNEMDTKTQHKISEFNFIKTF
jgi:hypothetical protein